MSLRATSTLIVEEPINQLVVVRQPADRVVIAQPAGLHVLRTVVATFNLPANYLVANSLLAVQFLGQVSSTATLTYKVRCGTTGLITDALLGTWAVSAAGVANAHTSLDALVHCLTAGTSGTAYAGGRAYLASAVLGPATAAFAAATVNTTVANKLTVTVVQSALQTLTSRTGVLERIA